MFLKALIRPMTERDLDEVLVIERTSFSNPWTDVMFLAELQENPFARFLVAARDDSILGYIGGWVIVDELHLLNLAVRPDSRCRGVAGQLVDSLFRSGEGRITTASLEVRRSNQSAIALYERFGFHQVGVRPGYYTDPLEDALVMGWLGEDERWRAPTEDGGPRERLNPEGGGYV
jgi:ribosomal-protein-alanine N-acetyltransferase